MIRKLFGQGLWLFAAASAQAQDATLAEVQVSAKADSQELRRHASAGKLVIDREELDTLDAASVGELLRKLPGTGMFTAVESGSRGRGKGPDRNMPQILVDGQPLPGGERNPMAALRLPVEMIERVEIIRNSTAEFPVLNPAGVVNLIMRDVPPRATRGIKAGAGAVGDDPQFRLEGQYGEPDGNFGYLLSGAVNRRPDASKRMLAATSYTAGVASGEIGENSVSTGSDTNLTLIPRFSWKFGGNQRITLSPFLSHTENESLTERQRSTAGVVSHDRQRDEGRRTSARLGSEWRISGPQGAETTARLMVQGESERVQQQARQFDAVGNLGSSIFERTERSEREWLGELRAKRVLLDAHVLTLAGEVRSQASEDSQRRHGSQTSSTDAQLKEHRQVIWAQDEWQVSDHHLLTPGLRWTYLATEIEDSRSGEVERKFRALDPSLHALWQVSDQWNLRASMASNSRTPRSKDLLPLTRLSTGTNAASNPDRAGNPNLEPERLRSIEAGIEYFLADRAGTIGLSAFHRHAQNHTQRLTQLEAGRWVERAYNVGEAELRGVVVDFKNKLIALGAPMLTLRGNAAYTHTRMLNKVAGLGAGEGPRKSVNIGADYEYQPLRLTLGSSFNYVSALDRGSSATLRQQQGARKQLDFYALYKLDRQVALRLSALNVTREERRNTLLETDASGVPVRAEEEFLPGRASYMLTLEARW